MPDTVFSHRMGEGIGIGSLGWMVGFPAYAVGFFLSFGSTESRRVQDRILQR